MALEHQDDVIRVRAMELLARADPAQLRGASSVVDRVGGDADSHRRGLSLLAGCLSADPMEVRRMLGDESVVVRMYGAVAAKRLVDVHPDLLQLAALSPDATITRFAEEAV